VKAVKVDLALRAVATAEAIEVDADDLSAEYARIAMQVRQKASESPQGLRTNDAVTDLMARCARPRRSTG
jgi:trigger factor